MFDQKKYESALAGFKQDFMGRQWPNEKYKWEAVKWFQDHWDVNAPDFAGMLAVSLKKTYNLLVSRNNFPRGMIEDYAKQAPEDVRAMFIALFDETTDVWERIDLNDTITMDSELEEAWSGDQPANSLMNGEFLRLKAGYNAYSWEGDVSSVIIQPRWRTL